MAADTPTEALPIFGDVARGFDAAMRGYDRAQVDRYVASAEEDLRRVSSERDVAVGQVETLTSRLSAVEKDAAAAKANLAAATESVTTRNVDTHVRAILDSALAEATREREEAADEATRLLEAARAEAKATTADAEREAEQLRATAKATLDEAELHKKQIERELTDRVTAAAAERQAQDAASAAERDRLDAAAAAGRHRSDERSAAARAQAEQDFELTLRARRSSEYATIERDRAAAEQSAAATLAEAKAKADSLVAGAQSHAQGLVADAQQQLGGLYEQHAQTVDVLAKLHNRLGGALKFARSIEVPSQAEPTDQPDSETVQ